MFEICVFLSSLRACAREDVVESCDFRTSVCSINLAPGEYSVHQTHAFKTAHEHDGEVHGRTL